MKYFIYNKITENSKVGSEVQKWWDKEKTAGNFSPGRRNVESNERGEKQPIY